MPVLAVLAAVVCECAHAIAKHKGPFPSCLSAEASRVMPAAVGEGRGARSWPAGHSLDTCGKNKAGSADMNTLP